MMRAVMNFSLYRTGNFLQREIFGRVPSPISLSLSLSLSFSLSLSLSLSFILRSGIHTMDTD